MVEEHGGDMSSRDKKDARRIQADFEFEEVGLSGRNSRGRRDRGDREREREPPPHAPQPNQPPRQAPPGPSRRREGFGGNLTAESASTAHQAEYIRRPTPSPPRGEIDPVVAQYAFYLSFVRAVLTLRL